MSWAGGALPRPHRIASHGRGPAHIDQNAAASAIPARGGQSLNPLSAPCTQPARNLRKDSAAAPRPSSSGSVTECQQSSRPELGVPPSLFEVETDINHVG